MLTVIGSWIIIFAAASIMGFSTLQVIGKKIEVCKQLDVILVMGLMIITVYAQCFSIFYKVGLKACFYLFIFGMVAFFIILRKKKTDFKILVRYISSISKKNWIIFILCVVFTALWTAKTPVHYDTYLYHAQAIRWIEEYGCVRGLGNFHNRIAYNSAFMPLQALFSLKWLTGQSLHTMNGFLCCFFLYYSVATNHILSKNNMKLSDFFKVAVIIYIYLNRVLMSSPCSDFLPLLLVLYISIKWSELVEQEIEDQRAYLLIGLIGIWAVTVKLSTAPCIFLIFFPLFIVFKRKRWKWLLLFCGLSLLITLPWLVRNVIISGYLVYPYGQIDLFPVDWKMPMSVLKCDYAEIMAWGRELKDVALFDKPFTSWLPIWFEAQEIGYQFLIIIGTLSACAVAGVVIYRMIKARGRKYVVLEISVLLGLASWLFSAPLMRYGCVYLIQPVCLVLFYILGLWKKAEKCIRIILCTFITLCFMFFLRGYGHIDGELVLTQKEYEWRETQEIEWNGIKVYVPTEGDQCGYEAFPGTPYLKLLDLIELRGNTIKEGFRPSEYYFESELNNSGREW